MWLLVFVSINVCMLCVCVLLTLALMKSLEAMLTNLCVCLVQAPVTQLLIQAIQVTQQQLWCRCFSCCCCVYAEGSWLCTCATAACSTASPPSPTATTTRASALQSSPQEMSLVRAIPSMLAHTRQTSSSFITLIHLLYAALKFRYFTLRQINNDFFVLPPKGDDDEDDPMIGGFADDVPMVIA